MKKIFYPLAAAFVIAADQFTKYLVRMNMQPGDRIPVIGDWLRIYYVQNTGTAFSMFAGNRFVTVVLTGILILVCVVFAIREIKDGDTLIPLLLTLIAAGGVSNMIDRLRLGFVTDMISCGSFAVFNVADIFVTCGCVLMMAAIIIMYREEEEANSSEKRSAEAAETASYIIDGGTCKSKADTGEPETVTDKPKADTGEPETGTDRSGSGRRSRGDCND